MRHVHRKEHGSGLYSGVLGRGAWMYNRSSRGLLEWSRVVWSFRSFWKLLRKVHKGPGRKGKTKGVRGVPLHYPPH